MKKKTLILIVALVVILAAAVALLYNKGMFASKHYYGKSVSVNYVGRFTDGRVFDTSIEEVAKKNARYNPQRGYAPLTFIVGSGDVVSGFENAIEGMAIGETKTVTLAPKDAYGEYDSGKIVWIPKTPFTQAKIEPKVNQSFSFSGKTFTIEGVSETGVKIDMNAPMAGKTLIFDITLVKAGKPMPKKSNGDTTAPTGDDNN